MLLKKVETKRYPQCFAEKTKTSARIYGLGFDRWHFVGHLDKNENFVTDHLVSVWSVSKFIYKGIDKFPCPIVFSLSETERETLDEFINREKEAVLIKKKKKTRKEQKEDRLKSFLEAQKRGEKTGFANPIGKKTRKR